MMFRRSVLICELLVILFLGSTVAHAGRDVFSVNFRGHGVVNAGLEEETTVDETESAGMGEWLTNGWLNIDSPFNGANWEQSFDLTSVEGQTATMVIHSIRNGDCLSRRGIRTAPANGTGNMMDGFVHATNNPSEPDDLRFNATVSGLPWSTYDVIFYLGCYSKAGNEFVIVFNGGQPIYWTPLQYDGTNFSEIVNSGDTGNYIIFRNVKGSSFTVVAYGVSRAGGPNGFQIRETNPKLASTSDPVDEMTDVRRDGVVLSWIPGEYAVQHDVYLGTDFEDVDDATTDSDVYVVRQAETTLVLDRLEFSTTYYWRVDEVNAPPDSTIFKGNVWSFTTEPVAYPVPSERITATASSSAPDQGPENTVNASGLDANDLHSMEGTEMWLTAMGAPGPAWIQYEFDKVLKLHEMWVWNQNTLMELAIGFGIKDATIEYSADGSTWNTLGTTHEFARGAAAPGYGPNTTVDFEGAAAKYVKLTPNSNWGGLLQQYGLSEVRFFSVPVFAGKPDPATDATNVDLQATLGWRAGREAVEHNVYLSTDEQGVIDGTAPVNTVTETSFVPSPLDLDTTYYWRVDEVNDAESPATRQGHIWSFSTQEYLVVDDFESYNEIPLGEEGSNLVYETWIDGYANPSANGSTMGHTVPFEPSMETGTAYDGRQSAPLYYDNTTAGMSEVTANTSDLAIGSDWTVGSPQKLVLWVYGATDNVAQQMYVKVGSAKEPYGGDITDPSWSQWNIDLAGLGINLSDVTQLSIGLERISGTGGSGMVLIDAIRLY